MIEVLVRRAFRSGYEQGSCSDLPAELEDRMVAEFLMKYAPGFHGEMRDFR